MGIQHSHEQSDRFSRSSRLGSGGSIIRFADHPQKLSQETENISTGYLKFFDEKKGYGFIVMNEDQSDIFCHLEDLKKAGLDLNSVQQLVATKAMIGFECFSYRRKQTFGKKAVNIRLIDL